MAVKNGSKSKKKSRPVRSQLQRAAAECCGGCKSTAEAVRQVPDFEPERPQWIMHDGLFVKVSSIDSVVAVDAESCEMNIAGTLTDITLPFELLAEIVIGDAPTAVLQEEEE